MEFSIQISNLDALVSKLKDAPSIAAPILQRAIAQSWQILAKNTTARTVPVRTGFLLQSFGGSVSGLSAIWGPDRTHRTSYSSFVEFGTRPHVIEAKDKKALYWKGADHPVKRVNHPGSAANPFMERILDASRDEINITFGKALSDITAAIAAR